MITGKYPSLRLRRSRKQSWSRRLVQENTLSPNDFILPIFLIDGSNKKESIKSMRDMREYCDTVCFVSGLGSGECTPFRSLRIVDLWVYGLYSFGCG